MFNNKYLDSHDEMSADEEYDYLKLLESMQFDSND